MLGLPIMIIIIVASTTWEPVTQFSFKKEKGIPLANMFRSKGSRYISGLGLGGYWTKKLRGWVGHYKVHACSRGAPGIDNAGELSFAAIAITKYSRTF